MKEMNVRRVSKFKSTYCLNNLTAFKASSKRQKAVFDRCKARFSITGYEGKSVILQPWRSFAK